MGGAVMLRWAAATACLGGALAALVAWIALRDYQPASALAGQRAAALEHAGQLLRLREGTGCASCRAGVVGPLREHLWRVSLEEHGAVRCFDVDNDTFAVHGRGGLTGVRLVSCPTR